MDSVAEKVASQGDILVTGGAGYIGSHVCVELMAAGYRPVIVDNLSNSKHGAGRRIAEIGGQEPVFYEQDLNDRAALGKVFARHDFAAAMHFAGLNAVGESSGTPLRHDRENGGSTRPYAAGPHA